MEFDYMSNRKDRQMFDEGDKAIIEKTAYAVAEKVEERLKKHFAEQITLHQAECPTKMRVDVISNWPDQARMFSKGFVIGIVCVSALVGSGMSVVVTKLISAITR